MMAHPFLITGIIATLLMFRPTGVCAESQASPTPLAELSTGKGARFIEVPVSVKNRDYIFLLDTGATQSCFDSRNAGILGPFSHSSEVSTPGGNVRVLHYRCPAATWLGLRIPEAMTVMVADLTPLRLASGRQIDGVIGMDILHRYRITLDFDAGSLKVWGEGAPFNKGGKYRLPLQMSKDHSPFVVMPELESGREPFLIDTGADTSTIRPMICERLRESGQFQFFLQNNWNSTAAGFARSQSGRLSSFQIGESRLQNIRFNVGDVGSLGLNILSRFQVELNFPESEMFLTPGKRISQADQPATSGLIAIWSGGQLTVASTIPNSHAAIAGIRPGDKIIGLNSRPVQQLDYRDVADILTSATDQSVVIDVVRDNKERTFVIQLAERRVAE